MRIPVAKRMSRAQATCTVRAAHACCTWQQEDVKLIDLPIFQRRRDQNTLNATMSPRLQVFRESNGPSRLIAELTDFSHLHNRLEVFPVTHFEQSQMLNDGIINETLRLPESPTGSTGWAKWAITDDGQILLQIHENVSGTELGLTGLYEDVRTLPSLLVFSSRSSPSNDGFLCFHSIPYRLGFNTILRVSASDCYLVCHHGNCTSVMHHDIVTGIRTKPFYALPLAWESIDVTKNREYLYGINKYTANFIIYHHSWQRKSISFDSKVIGGYAITPSGWIIVQTQRYGVITEWSLIACHPKCHNTHVLFSRHETINWGPTVSVALCDPTPESECEALLNALKQCVFGGGLHPLSKLIQSFIIEMPRVFIQGCDNSGICCVSLPRFFFRSPSPPCTCACEETPLCCDT